MSMVWSLHIKSPFVWLSYTKLECKERKKSNTKFIGPQFDVGFK
jgi:hypothetical protein